SRTADHRQPPHAINSNGRKNEHDNSKTLEQRYDDAIAGENFIVKSSRRSGKISRKIRVEPGNRSPQNWTKSVSPLTHARTDKDRAKLRSGRCAQQGHVKSHAVGLLIERALHQGVRHDADNGSPRLRFTGIEDSHLVTDRALVAPIFSGKTRIHNCHRLLRIDIVNREIAAFE